MLRRVLFTAFMLAGIVVAAACRPGQVGPAPEANMPNPASVHCEQNGGTLEFRQDPAGGVAGMCVFPDGSECDEWAYFRGECKPGDSLATPVPAASPAATEPAPAAIASPAAIEPTPTATPEVAGDGWKVYRNEQLGYTFDYPADASIGTADDPLKTLTIIGPMTEGDNWPVIYFSHPGDREEYRPPEGVDLEKWLIDHNLLMAGDGEPAGEVRQPDVQVAGTTAIHTRLPRSPQTYAFDKYYFANAQQLYVVVILHTGDKEDWELYSRFLESIQFEK